VYYHTLFFDFEDGKHAVVGLYCSDRTATVKNKNRGKNKNKNKNVGMIDKFPVFKNT
jgi:hypothetical protein